MRALSNERRVLGQNLQVSEAARIEVECRVLSTAQYEMELMRADHDRELSAANKAWASLLERELEELKLQDEDTAKRISKETKLKMKEVEVSFMAVVEMLNTRDSELSKLRKKEAIRTMNQGTVRDPSAKAKTPCPTKRLMKTKRRPGTEQS